MTTKNEKTITAVATADNKAPAKKAAAKTEKVLTMPQVKSAARAAGVTFVKCKNTAANYVIFDGKTSLHIKKSGYRVYATAADVELIKCLALTATNIIIGGNAIDKCRPHTIDVGNNADLKLILAAIAVNNHVELA